MPEWYVVVLGLGGLSALSLLWPKLIAALPFFLVAASATVGQAILSAAQASFPSAPRSRFTRLKLYAMTACLHLAQPLARLWGRARHGLTAFRLRGPRGIMLPFPKSNTLWSEGWRSPEQALGSLTQSLRKDGTVLVQGGECDRWDLEVRGGTLGAARLFMTVEEHGAGKQLFRFRCTPKFSPEGVIAILLLTALTVGAAIDEYWLAYNILAAVTLVLLGRTLYEVACAMSALQRALKRGFDEQP